MCSQIKERHRLAVQMLRVSIACATRMSMIFGEVLAGQRGTAIDTTLLFAKIAISSTQLAKYIQIIDRLITLQVMRHNLKEPNLRKIRGLPSRKGYREAGTPCGHSCAAPATVNG